MPDHPYILSFAASTGRRLHDVPISLPRTRVVQDSSGCPKKEEECTLTTSIPLLSYKHRPFVFTRAFFSCAGLLL